jgi:Fe-Mn family superoxide dismutase
MLITLPELPYKKEDLAPHISAKTLEIHHEKHHNAYVTNLNALIESTDLMGQPLESIITRTAGDPKQTGIFNNAAQVWNHSFYWQSMMPGGGGLPTGPISGKIDSDLDGYGAFIEKFKNAALTQFGSGWVWLVLKNGKLDIVKTSNAETPLSQGVKPLLTVDVWEHAYYLDYQNRRGDYVDAFVRNLINWDFINSNMT